MSKDEEIINSYSQKWLFAKQSKLLRPSDILAYVRCTILSYILNTVFNA